MSSDNNGILYFGAIDYVKRKVFEHKIKKYRTSFSAIYNLDWLVYYDVIKGSWEDALKREKQIKEWNRAWKMRLIQEQNEDWLDLSTNWNFDNYKNLE